MPTTSNFGWTTPADTDLVKDGAAAIRTLGNGIDTSFLDLKGGTTGQVLAKASNTDLDFTWSAADPLSILDAKGDLISATAADTPARLAVGSNNQVLTADSSTSTGLKWATPSAGSLRFIQRSSFTDVATTGTTFDSVFTSTYRSYQVIIEKVHAVTGATADAQLQMDLLYSGTTQTANYYGGYGFMGTTFAGSTTNNAAQFVMTNQVGYDVLPNSYIMYFAYVGNASEKAQFYGMGFGSNNSAATFFSGGNSTARTYTGFRLKAASGNITGTVAIYGIATS